MFPLFACTDTHLKAVTDLAGQKKKYALENKQRIDFQSQETRRLDYFFFPMKAYNIFKCNQTVHH